MQIPLPFIDSDTADLGQNPEISSLISTPANLDVGDPDLHLHFKQLSSKSSTS